MKFKGYERPDGSVGVRNHILVIAAAFCSEPVARLIAEGIKGAVVITQHYDCIPGEMVANTLVAIGENPNVAAVLLVDMGCEGMRAEPLGQVIKRSGKLVDWICIQDLRGTHNAVIKGRQIIKAMAGKIQALERKEFDVSKLMVGLKCGGSDTTSGLSGNPAAGIAADILVDAGGAALMAEPVEAVGAEDVLAKRAINEDVRKKIYRMVANEEKRLGVPGTQLEFMCGGNAEGGLTSIEEKALGAIRKGGTRPIKGVLEASERLVEKVPEGGFYLQDTTHEEGDTSLMAAAGAQIVIFTTGRGATLGHAIVPMIKIVCNPETYTRMKDDMDINASTVIDGQESIETVGRRIFNEIVAVASGKLTRAEVLGYNNFGLFRRDPRLDALLGIS